ncbi:MAG: tetratricopeptide repeat protein [Bacteroidia bacterium]
MNKRLIQIAVVLFISLLVITLYIKGKNSAQDKLELSSEVKLPNQSDWDFNIQSAIDLELAKDSISLSFGNLYSEPISDSVKWIPKVANIWDSLGHSLFAGYYFEKLATLTNDANHWYKAGSKYFNLVNRTNDSFARREIGNHTIVTLSKVVELDPNNLKAKSELGVSYMELLPKGVSPMTGVGLLREVIQQDSNNVDALYYLAYLSMKSGQYDKAVVRLEKLTSLKPEEASFYEYLATAYLKAGNKEMAKSTIMKYTELTNSDVSRERALKFIEQLNSN